MGSRFIQFRLSAIKRGVSRARARSREPERSPPQLLCVWGLRAACSSSAAGRGGGEATPAPGASGLPGTPRKPSPMAADVPAHMISQVQRAMMATIPGTHMMGTLMSFCEECCWDGTCAAAVLVFQADIVAFITLHSIHQESQPSSAGTGRDASCAKW